MHISGADINKKDRNGNTALGIAVLNNRESCALMLMQKGANINQVIKTSNEVNDPKTLDKGFSYKYLPHHFQDEPKEQTMTLFQGLVQNDWLGLTFLAMQQLEIEGMSYSNCIEVAFELKKFHFAKRLIEKQVSPDPLLCKVKHGQNLLLSFASHCPSTEDIVSQTIVTLLINAGVKITDLDDNGSSIVHILARTQNLHMLQFISQKMSANEFSQLLQVEDRCGRTPLMASFWNKSTSLKQVATYLIKNGSQINMRAYMKPLSHLNQDYQPSNSNYFAQFDDINQEEVTPLIIAAVFGMVDLMQLLIKAGAKIDFCDGKGRTPLMHVCKTNDVDLVSQLLKFEPTIDYKDPDGLTVLHHVVGTNESYVFDNVDLFKKLMAKSKDVEEKVKSLHIMANQNGSHKICNFIASKFKNLHLSHMDENNGSFGLPPSPIETGFNFDVTEDALKMFEILEKKAKEAQMNGHQPPNVQIDDDSMEVDDDDDDESAESGDEQSEMSEEENDSENNANENVNKPRGCEVKDGEIVKDYSVTMLKVDVSIGAWGLYNYYRMQLWKEKDENLFILFTNWYVAVYTYYY